MLFQSPQFILFFIFVLGLLTAIRCRGARHSILLLASYAFYAAWDVRFTALLLISTLVDWVAAAQIERNTQAGTRRAWLILSLSTNLGILGAFKYYDFFAQSASDLAMHFGVALQPHTLDVILPVGISFYTFQSLSYTIDVYRGVSRTESSLMRYALYVAFFPQLVAGPIVRARQFLPQLNRDAPPRLANLAPGLMLFAVGLFKKVVIADNMARLVDPLVATPEFYGSGVLLLGLFAYAGQIYCDFSGYSDMAIGVGRILGYRLPRNFNRPYSACSPREFWQRWHITLSTWIRDYIYISLGGNRRSLYRTHLNLMITMLLAGLWHGANWTFVTWGGAHGVAVSADRLIAPRRYRGVLAWAATTILVVTLFLIFRSPTLTDAGLYLSRILSWPNAIEAPDLMLLVWIVLLLVVIAFGQSQLGAQLEQRARRLRHGTRMFVAGLLIGLAYALSAGENRAFIYFQF